MKDSLSNYLKNLFLKNLKNQKTNRRADRFEIHATDIPTLCVRYALICYKYGIPLANKKEYPIKTYLTFRIGDKIEDIAREMLDGKKPPPIAIRIGKIYIVGSPDIVVKGKYIVECKSINRDFFNSLQRPIVKHEAQLSFYLWLAEKVPHLGYSTTGAIIYIPKEETDDIIKVFPITLRDVYRKSFDRVITQIRAYIQTHKLPDRVCVDTNSVMARKCPLVKYCFKGGKHDRM